MNKKSYATIKLISMIRLMIIEMSIRQVRSVLCIFERSGYIKERIASKLILDEEVIATCEALSLDKSVLTVMSKINKEERAEFEKMVLTSVKSNRQYIEAFAIANSKLKWR